MSSLRERVRKSVPDWESEPFSEPKFHRLGFLAYLPTIEMLG